MQKNKMIVMTHYRKMQKERKSMQDEFENSINANEEKRKEIATMMGRFLIAVDKITEHKQLNKKQLRLLEKMVIEQLKENNEL